jgi:hypothetical protein
MNPLTSSRVTIRDGDRILENITELPAGMQRETLQTIFYGKGRGIHSTQPFTGVLLKDILEQKFRPERNNLRTALVTIAGADGYRSVYTFSEIVNRNDQAGILLVPCANEEDGGKFRIFPSCDFFSDRAVKAVSMIIFERFNP